MRKVYFVEGNSWGWLCAPLSLCTSCSEKSRATGLSFNVTLRTVTVPNPSEITDASHVPWTASSFEYSKII
jgi:hypothetical protein